MDRFTFAMLALAVIVLIALHAWIQALEDCAWMARRLDGARRENDVLADALACLLGERPDAPAAP